jgi:hypothetical protein
MYILDHGGYEIDVWPRVERFFNYAPSTDFTKNRSVAYQKSPRSSLYGVRTTLQQSNTDETCRRSHQITASRGAVAWQGMTAIAKCHRPTPLPRLVD